MVVLNNVVLLSSSSSSFQLFVFFVITARWFYIFYVLKSSNHFSCCYFSLKLNLNGAVLFVCGSSFLSHSWLSSSDSFVGLPIRKFLAIFHDFECYCSAFIIYASCMEQISLLGAPLFLFNSNADF